MGKLAIVIPVYKILFFEAALKSIALQTCNDFTVYIGNDASEYDFKAIIEKYSGTIEIIYTYFKKNVGRKNLVQQWERCIDLVRDEEWIWLFSDDDVMEPTCVENFYSTFNNYPGYNIYHFDVLKIDTNGKIIDKFFSFPEVMSREDFIITKLQKPEGFSTVVEYVFKKSHFFDQDRFTNFDLAWCSDDATWVKLAKGSGIKAILKAHVYWRESPFNISPNSFDKQIELRKLGSDIQFAEWIVTEFEEEKTQKELILIKKLLKNRLFLLIKYRVHFLKYAEILKLLITYKHIVSGKAFPIYKLAFLYIYKIYKFVKLKSVGFNVNRKINKYSHR